MTVRAPDRAQARPGRAKALTAGWDAFQLAAGGMRRRRMSGG